jgi:hypothetical protein
MMSSAAWSRKATVALLAAALVQAASARPPAPVTAPADGKVAAPAGVQPAPRVADQLRPSVPLQLPPARPVPVLPAQPAPAAGGTGSDADCKPVTGGEVCGGVFYQGGRGARQGVAVDPVPNVNLKVVAVEWLPPQSLTDPGAFVQAAQAAGKVATVGPRFFGAVVRTAQRGLTTTVGPQERSTAVESVVVSPVVRVRIRNEGRERWAAAGTVDVSVRPGTANEAERLQPLTLVPVPGLKPHPAIAGVGHANRLGQVSAQAAIPGSLGRGEAKDVQVAFLHGLHHSADQLARYRYLFDVDKWYTAVINLKAQDPVNPQDKVYKAQFRLGPDGRALEMRLTAVDTPSAPAVRTQVVR